MVNKCKKCDTKFFEENNKTKWLRILTVKKHHQIKLKRLRKVWIWTFEWLVHQISDLYEVLKLKQIFRKNKLVTGKPPFSVIGPFSSPHICVNSGF